MPEGGDGLAAQNPARRVGDGAADDERQALAGVFKILVDGKQRRLGIERVENGFHQQHVRAAFDQRFGLLVIGLAEFFKTGVACARVVHIRADAGGFGRRAERADDKARFVRRGELVAG